jgi:hypothetical protein
LALGGVSYTEGPAFNRHMVKVGPFLTHALADKDPALSRIASGFVSDLSASLEQGMNEHAHQLIPKLIDILSDQNYDKNTKVVAL